MSTKAGLLVALVLNLLCVYGARAEDPPVSMGASGSGPAGMETAPETLPGPESPMPPGRLSSYITYARPDCCGPVGGNGPITYELYAVTGPTLPVGGNFLAHNLQTGWEVGGGGRSIFYNVPQTAACTIDVSLTWMYNHGDNAALISPIDGSPQTLNKLDRTFVSLGVGREWYFMGSAANNSDWKWLAGVEGGGRYGTARLEMHDPTGQVATHVSDVPGAAYLAVYTNVEVPCGCCCTFFGGLRAEYDYTWMDILQENSDVQDINFLITAGVRF